MVKLKGPLLSLEAHGKLANTLNYSAKKSGSQVRKFHYPKKKVTGAQWTQRHIMGMLTARWQVMTTEEKAPYLVSAKIANPVITGFNYFVRVAQTDLATHLGLVVYLPFNESSGADLLDASGTGNNGTLKPTYPSDVPSRKPAMITQYGNALSLNGSSHYINCNKTYQSYFRDSFTMSIWLKAKDGRPSGNSYLYGSRLYSETYMFSRVETSGKIGFYYMSNAKTAYARTLYSLLRDGQEDWHHVACVIDKSVGSYGQMYIYFDGELQELEVAIDGNLDTNSVVMADWSSTRNLYLGAQNDDNVALEFFDGELDEFVLCNRAFAASEIKKQFNLLRQNKKRQERIVH